MAALLRHAACSSRPRRMARALSFHPIARSSAAEVAPASYCDTDISSLPWRSATEPASLNARAPPSAAAMGARARTA
eukprot:scaffold59617_cov79-Phaeocystis_antarctica.AAC.23